MTTTTDRTANPLLVSQSAPTRVRGSRKSRAKGDETRQRIVEEAARCILEEGFAGASANRVAARSGVTWGVIQYHFGDRAGLLREVVQAGFDGFVWHIEQIAVPLDGDVRARLRAVVDGGWEAFNAPMSRASIEILVNSRAVRAHDPEPAAELLDMARGLHRLLVKAFPGIDDDPSSTLASVVWSTLRGFVLGALMAPVEHDYHAERELLVEVVATYLEASDRPR